MQHAWKHVERPGGSHTALDGKKRACGLLRVAAGRWLNVAVPSAGICIDQMSDNRTTDNWPRITATKTATNVPT